jgi:hypothetical protein
MDDDDSGAPRPTSAGRQMSNIGELNRRDGRAPEMHDTPSPRQRGPIVSGTRLSRRLGSLAPFSPAPGR